MLNNSVDLESRKGFAKIKKQYLKTDHRPVFDPKHVPQTALKQIVESIDSNADGKKLRGKNKKRPQEKRPNDSGKLCSTILGGNVCTYGSNCKFSHDIEKFVSSNNDELDGNCYCYDTYGICQYGLSCLFRSQHINIEYKNLIDKTKIAHNVYKKTFNFNVSNCLSKGLQIKLRKREYSFTKANKVYHTLCKRKKQEVCLDEKEDAINVCDKKDDENKNVTEKNFNTNSTLNEDKTHETKNNDVEVLKTIGCLTDEDVIRLKNREKLKIDFRGKLYLAPLTTVGNLPFRRICKSLGVDVTCGEMAMTSNLLQGQASEWALLKRHASENLFGIQLCGTYPDSMARATQVISEQTDVNFIDVNIGCPIDLVIKRGDGCAMMSRLGKLENSIKCITSTTDLPVTLKMRAGLQDNKNLAHFIMPKAKLWDLSLVTIHGRSREQRYTRLADWKYIQKCAQLVRPTPVFGNGDVLSHEDYYNCIENYNVDGAMIARGALIKPWIFTEIKERRTWDISAVERLDIIKQFVNYGLEHWGSDKQGVANTRKFLLEWMSFTHRYIPAGLLEVLPQKINEKPPSYFGRSDLETLLGSHNCADWIKISEMLLGPVPPGFTFLPKHKANSYQ